MEIIHKLNRTIKYMARVILDVPSDKMKAFLKSMVNLGIDQNAIQVKTLTRTNKQKKSTLFKLHQISRSFLLFDWEFFSNELEYE